MKYIVDDNDASSDVKIYSWLLVINHTPQGLGYKASSQSPKIDLTRYELSIFGNQIDPIPSHLPKIKLCKPGVQVVPAHFFYVTLTSGSVSTIEILVNEREWGKLSDAIHNSFVRSFDQSYRLNES